MKTTRRTTTVRKRRSPRRKNKQRLLVLAALKRSLAFALVFSVFAYTSLVNVSIARAAFTDQVTLPGNSVTAGTLIIGLEPDENWVIVGLEPGESDSKEVKVIKLGTADFRYQFDLVPAPETNDDLCSVLQIEAILDGDSLGVGTFSNLDIPPVVFSESDNHESDNQWQFIVTLPEGADEELINQTCELKFVFMAWQTNLPFGQGFSDTAEFLGTFSTGTWGGGNEEPIDEPDEPDLGGLEEFVIFGASDVSDDHDTDIGNGTSVFAGLVGSNRSVTFGTNTLSQGIRAGANIEVGNGSEVGDYGIIANGTVTFNTNASTTGEIHGGNVAVGNGSQIKGHIFSNAKLTTGTNVLIDANADAKEAKFGNGSNLTGTLTLPNGVSPDEGNNVTINNIVNNGEPEPTLPNTFGGIVLPAPNYFEAGADNLNFNNNASTTLAAGVYGKLEAGNSFTLNLSAGTYVFESISLGTNATINADVSGGEILIFVERDVDIGNGLKFNASDAEKIYLESAGVVKIGTNGSWYGTIYSTKHDEPGKPGINLGNGTKVWGALYSAQQVKLGTNLEVHLVGPFFGVYEYIYESEEVNSEMNAMLFAIPLSFNFNEALSSGGLEFNTFNTFVVDDQGDVKNTDDDAEDPQEDNDIKAIDEDDQDEDDQKDSDKDSDEENSGNESEDSKEIQTDNEDQKADNTEEAMLVEDLNKPDDEQTVLEKHDEDLDRGDEGGDSQDNDTSNDANNNNTSTDNGGGEQSTKPEPVEQGNTSGGESGEEN